MDANKPTDQEMGSALAIYLREVRAAVNALSAGTGVGTTTLNMVLGTTLLDVGVDLGMFGVDLVRATADVAVSIDTIIHGISGQIKIFIALDGNITLVDGIAAGGHLYLNQLPALSSFAMQTGDVIALVNIDGDGSVITGYWRELFRSVALK